MADSEISNAETSESVTNEKTISSASVEHSKTVKQSSKTFVSVDKKGDTVGQSDLNNDNSNESTEISKKQTNIINDSVNKSIITPVDHSENIFDSTNKENNGITAQACEVGNENDEKDNLNTNVETLSQKMRQNLLYSDSEDNQITTKTLVYNENDSKKQNLTPNVQSSGQKKRNFINSDSEDDQIATKTLVCNESDSEKENLSANVQTSTQKRRQNFIDSDSEDDQIPIKNFGFNESDSEKENVTPNVQTSTQKKQNLIDSDSEDNQNTAKTLLVNENDLVKENLTPNVQTSTQKKQNLIDSDSEDNQNTAKTLLVNENDLAKENLTPNVQSSTQKKQKLIHSDSEDNQNSAKTLLVKENDLVKENLTPNIQTSMQEKQNLIDSDSEDNQNTAKTLLVNENDLVKENLTPNVQNSTQKKQKLIDSDSDDDQITNKTLVFKESDSEKENLNTNVQTSTQKKQNLIDSDSEDDQIRTKTLVFNESYSEKENLSTNVQTSTQKKQNFIDSDSEDDQNTAKTLLEENLTPNVQSSTQKKQSLIDSDFEANQNTVKTLLVNENDSGKENLPNIQTSTQKKRQNFIDSDSEDDQIPIKTFGFNESDSEKENLTPNVQTSILKKRQNFIDSDSDNEIVSKTYETDKSDSNQENLIPNIEISSPKKKSRLMQLIDSDSEDEINSENVEKPEEPQKTFDSEDIFDENIFEKQQASRLKKLCDSESSADETKETNVQNERRNVSKQRKKPNKKAETPTGKKMSGRDALEQRRQIQSESQKMMRESGVSLPYHRPKQHTLQDFLKRRSRLEAVISVPPNTPTTFVIKMSSEQLKITAERLKQREKEIELFYKSSDSEDEPEFEEPAFKEAILITETEKNQIENKEETKNSPTETEIPKIPEMTTSSEEILNIDSISKSDDAKIPEEISEVEQQIEDLPSNEERNSVEDRNSAEDNPEIKELRNLLQKYSGANLEHLMEQPEAMEIEETEVILNSFEQSSELEEQPLKSVEEISKLPEIIVKDAMQNEEPSKDECEEPSKDECEEPSKNECQEPSKDECEEPSKDECEEFSEQFIEDHFTANMQCSVQEYEVKKKTPDKETELEKKIKKLNPIISLKKSFLPRLSRSGGDFIVLDEGVERSKGVNDLMKRFYMHTAKKSVEKKPATTTEVNAQIPEDSILNVDETDDEPAKKIQTPGLKYKILREELEEQIAKKRLEEWKKRQHEKKLENKEMDVYEGEKTDCGLTEENILDDDCEEDEFTDEDSSSEDEEIDDVQIIEKPRVKSAFVDEEAEESEIDDDPTEDPIEETIENDDSLDEDEDSDDFEENNSDIEENEVTDVTVKKQLKRIIKAFEDSDDENEENKEEELNEEILEVNQQNTSNNLEGTQDEISVYQPPQEKTPCKPITQNKNDLTNILTPTFHLTALQGMNSASKNLNSPGIHLALSPDPSPLRSHVMFKTKLFSENENVEDNFDELENLCSGKFTANTQNFENNENKIKCAGLSTQDTNLLNICSGNFTGLTSSLKDNNTISNEKHNNILNIDLQNENSQDFSLTFDDNSLDANLHSKPEIKIDKSQNIEKKNKEKTINSDSIPFEFRKLNMPKFVIASSDEEEEDSEISRNASRKSKMLKKKRRKYIIDDISITDDEDVAQDDFSDLEMNPDEEISGDENEEIAEKQNIDYDSEENEIEMVEMEKETAQKKAREFFEAEAELSGSDWDSADEDEKDLDDFEQEEADNENINEHKLQKELGRMHVHNIIEEDKRDIRLLQELLLEDGELHGAGREKKFRWKNAESLSWNEESKPKEDDEEYEEIENEAEWRKMRHEREMFLKEQELKQPNQVTEEEQILRSDSQIMKLGAKALVKSLSKTNSQQRTPIAESVAKSDDIKLPFALANQRGSFLMRSETTLARLAQITRPTAGINGLKNSKNFVFTSVEKSDVTTDIAEHSNEKKRKAEEGTPKPLKRLRIADVSPSAQKFKRKLIK